MRFFSALIVVLVSFLYSQTTLINSNERSVELLFQLPEVEQGEITIDNQLYTRLDYDGAIFEPIPGAPMIPHTIIRVAIPPGATVTPHYRMIQDETMSAIDLLPSIVVSGLGENNIIPRDESIYSSDNPYPGVILQVGEPYNFRHMRLVDVRIYPVQYTPISHQVQLLKQIEIRLDFKGANSTNRDIRLSKDDREILKSKVLNFSQGQKWLVSEKVGWEKTLVNYDLSVGDWFKIPITEEGIYRITGSFLQDRGININQINLSTVQLFTYGGDTLPYSVARPRPGDLNEVAIEVRDYNQNGVMDSDDEIFFYGRSFEGWEYYPPENDWIAYHNPYTLTNYYLLTFNQQPGKRIPVVASPEFPNATPVEQFTDRLHFEEDQFNILSSGIDWQWVRLRGTSDQATVNFNLPQNLISTDVEFCARLKGGSGSFYTDPQNYQYTVNISANGNSILSNITFSNESRVDRCATTNSFVPGSNELSLSYSANIESAYMFLDYFELKFNRPLIAENDKLKIFYKVGTTPLEFQVSGLPSGENRVWDVSDFANIEAIHPLENGSTVRFHAQETQTTPKIYYVFSPSAALPISDIQRIPNHANLRDPNRKGKLLIITPREFYDTAEQFEILKETQVPRPVETERVILDEIYVEFSSGVPDPTAIRDFIKYAYNNWGQSDIDRFRPEYVWLLGDGSYDYRNIELTNYRNWIPVYEINGNDDIFSRVSDNFFTAINNTKNNNSDLNPVLSVGRLPANSQEEVEHYLQKMITYSQSYLGNTIDKGWQSILTFVADDECAGSGGCGECFHLRQTEDIITRVPSKFDLKKIYLTDFPTEAGGLGRTKPQAAEALLNAINRGTLLINFFGHGDPNTWAHEQVLNKGRDLPRIHNEGKLPLWIAATCTWGKYDNPNIPSMAEAVIWSADKGGIGVIAASRAVFAFQNERFVDKLIQYLFPQKSDTAHSEIIGNAMLRALGGGSNDQKYHLLGDPSLRLADPEHMVQITNISSDTLKALSTATITAQITNTDGTPLTSFNGKAVIRVFDAVDSLNKCSRNYVYAGGSIFRGVVTVENGQLQSSFIIPKSIKYKNSRTGRVSIYAWSEDTRDAVGYVDTLLFLGSTTAVNDVEGPQIDFTFEGQPDFFDGDFVPQQPNLVVRLEDQSGINLTGEVGHRIELIIDGRIKKDVTEFFVYDENSYQSGELRYTLPALSSGQHQLIISAWDNLNNYSEARINFNTASASELTLAQVVNYPNPFSDNTYFTFQFQSPNGSAEVTIKIYTVNGRLIRELESFAQPGFNKVFWDGTDRDGNLVANGVYLYKIVVDDGENTLEKIEKLAIVR